MNYGLIVLILFPVVAGIISYVLGKKNENLRNDWIDIAMWVQLVLMVCLVVEYRMGYNLTLSVGKFFGTGLSLVADPIRILLLSLVTVVFWVVSRFMRASFQKESDVNGFYLLYLCMLGMFQGVLLSDNFFNTLLFMLMCHMGLFPMLLVRKDKAPKKNTRIYALFMGISYICVIAGMLLLVSELQSTAYSYLFLVTQQGITVNILLGGILSFIGLAIWAGMFPVQQLVTRSSNLVMIEVAGIVATVFSKLGIFILIVFMRSIFHGSQIIGKSLLAVALLTIVWGLLISLISTDIRKILSGINIAVNGIMGISGAIAILDTASSGYPLRSFLYILISSSLSLLILYMVSLELVREARTYEIKGLIAVGKRHKLLGVVALIAGATLIGIPGTMGFLGSSLLVKSVLTVVKWKWLIGVYILQGGLYVTAIARWYMKLFVSKKEETMYIMTSKEKLEASEQKKEPSDPQNAYRQGEILLVIVSLVLVVVGILPHVTIDRLSNGIDTFFYLLPMADKIYYYTTDVLLVLVVVAILGFLLYFNLVHGVVLRAVRNKKNKKIQKEMGLGDKADIS